MSIVLVKQPTVPTVPMNSKCVCSNRRRLAATPRAIFPGTLVKLSQSDP
jgi:hypothetical protein